MSRVHASNQFDPGGFFDPEGFAPSASAPVIGRAGSGETSPKPLRGEGGPDPPTRVLAGSLGIPAPAFDWR